MILHKYSGCGNDPILLDHTEDADYGQLAASLCAKEKYDAGGLIAVKTGPLEMTYYNKDGSRAPMCGNGTRCFARCVNGQNRMDEQRFDIETLAGTRKIVVLASSPFYCSVDMEAPDDSPEKIKTARSYPIRNQEMEIGGEKVTIISLFLRTIRTVVFAGSSREEVWKKRSELVRYHPLFKEKTNANFVEVVSEQELTVRTYERGVGWALACGTDRCASYTIAKETGKVSADQVIVHLEQGGLIISDEDMVQMASPIAHE